MFVCVWCCIDYNKLLLPTRHQVGWWLPVCASPINIFVYKHTILVCHRFHFSAFFISPFSVSHACLCVRVAFIAHCHRIKITSEIPVNATCNGMCLELCLCVFVCACSLYWSRARHWHYNEWLPTASTPKLLITNSSHCLALTLLLAFSTCLTRKENLKQMPPFVVVFGWAGAFVLFPTPAP